MFSYFEILFSQDLHIQNKRQKETNKEKVLL